MPLRTHQQYCRSIPGHVVLGQDPNDGRWLALADAGNGQWVLSNNMARFFWSGPVFSLMGMTEVDGRIEAIRQQLFFAGLHPDLNLTVLDARDRGLPVMFDWEPWIGQQHGAPRPERNNLHFLLRPANQSTDISAPAAGGPKRRMLATL